MTIFNPVTLTYNLSAPKTMIEKTVPILVALAW